jgi:hypothetical protein
MPTPALASAVRAGAAPPMVVMSFLGWRMRTRTVRLSCSAATRQLCRRYPARSSALRKRVKRSPTVRCSHCWRASGSEAGSVRVVPAPDLTRGALRLGVRLRDFRDCSGKEVSCQTYALSRRGSDGRSKRLWRNRAWASD